MSWRGTVQSYWQALARREQRLLLMALTVVGGALLWWLALAPALAVLKVADPQRLALDAQLQQMQRLQQQARALLALPTLTEPEARRAFDTALKSLGESAGLTVQMERLVVTLKGTQAQPLALWLASVRQNAHLLPVEVRLKRNTLGSWDGVVVFVLPTS
ncbi:MAG: type II secretion system protein M [Rhodoferax sp.]|uniref:type II secretion system protein GspM n=1 Tax=Rhodoferax sp. TaxID=50421 RepID=UPI001B5AA4F3|nr:type II secretion system protein GspM [Rhodoferax sp.]MBP9905617.1 type II secretion system protein M [Rhodoferax sp.]